jgi:uncharacterized membrane protein YfcA
MDLMAKVVLAVQAAPGARPSASLLTFTGFLGGFTVGVAGMGGGALLTPALVLLFKIEPKVAIASDGVSFLAMKPVGGAPSTPSAAASTGP